MEIERKKLPERGVENEKKMNNSSAVVVDVDI